MMAPQNEGPAPQGDEPVRQSRSHHSTGQGRQMTALDLLNQSLGHANVVRYCTAGLIDIAGERVRHGGGDYADLKVAMVLLHAEMVAALDDLIDTKLSIGFTSLQKGVT